MRGMLTTAPNYPTLRFNQSGNAIKNWLNDARF